ncbi:hypothetical protein D9758_011113 [Tetrapyrgos nigripes]|uniref:Major facilitator superfamily (MFS) profile domain-containing protein n=1 Tax=Tetrapyrgos nigripes TaxID=182062 RepID=A0A8H5CLT5_9AGAR|nr:hypothetical protein D9758_011113 [Tetrapyrgos nigripes]
MSQTLPTMLEDSHNGHGQARSPTKSSGHHDSESQSIPMTTKPTTTTTTKTTKAPYSVYSKNEKWFIVLVIAVSGLFSPLTANVYFPAIPAMAKAFNKSTELINLTITMYMVFQGIAPMFFGALADYVGRRLIYASCLAILSLSCVGLALCPTDAYWLLMVLRCVQATGSTSTIALGAGVIGDIAEPFERGGFIGTYGVGPLVGPAIGPVIGGALVGSLGWRLIDILVPCNSRRNSMHNDIVNPPRNSPSHRGNGSILPPPLLCPIIPIVAGYKKTSASGPTEEDLETKSTKKKFRNPFTLLLSPDISLLLFFNGTVSSVYYAVTVSISSIFVKIYPFLSEIEIGLCFLCIGGGMTIGSIVSGKILDREYHSVSKTYRLSKMGDDSGELDVKAARDDPDFPIEYARLRATAYYMVLFIGAVMGYGWCIQEVTHISVPLILQFFIGLSAILFLNAVQTVIVDLVPTQSSSAAACNNLFRGVLGAVLTSVIDLILNALTAGWTYVLLGGICALLTPLVWVVIKIGPTYRKKRREKEMWEAEKGMRN